MDRNVIHAWNVVLRKRVGQHRSITLDDEPIERSWWEDVGPSIAAFQLGESGGGRHIEASAISADREDLVSPMRLFVMEEQEHARLLGLVLDSGNVERKTTHWTDGAFATLRHLGGIRTELFMLLVAEIIGFHYYATLAKSAPTRSLRRLFGAIRDDEAAHFAFLIAVMNSLFVGWSPFRRRLALGIFRAVADVSAVVMAWDHRRALRRSGRSPAGFISSCWQLRRALVDQLSGSPYPLLLANAGRRHGPRNSGGRARLERYPQRLHRSEVV